MPENGIDEAVVLTDGKANKLDEQALNNTPKASLKNHQGVI
ncbi:hypothetical protein ACFOG5_17180 [Pedobacter fastidiosus]